MLVAGQVVVLLPGSLQVDVLLCCPENRLFQENFMIVYIYMTTKATKNPKKIIRSKNNRPDIRLQVLRCPLPDFVAVSFARLISFMEADAYAK